MLDLWDSFLWETMARFGVYHQSWGLRLFSSATTNKGAAVSEGRQTSLKSLKKIYVDFLQRNIWGYLFESQNIPFSQKLVKIQHPVDSGS